MDTSRAIGVDIELKTIKISIFKSDGVLISRNQISAPEPFIPGALTVKICDAINSFNMVGSCNYLGIIIPESLIVNGCFIEGRPPLRGWLNVPFAAWLELRLNVKVKLIEREELCLAADLNQKWHSDSTSAFSNAFIAAYLAAQFFKGEDSYKLSS